MNWVNAVLTDSDKLLNSDHFALGFETKNSNDLSNFKFSYFECKKKKKKSKDYKKKKKLEFTSTKRKIPVIKL